MQMQMQIQMQLQKQAMQLLGYPSMPWVCEQISSQLSYLLRLHVSMKGHIFGNEKTPIVFRLEEVTLASLSLLRPPSQDFMLTAHNRALLMPRLLKMVNMMDKVDIGQDGWVGLASRTKIKIK